MASRSPLATLLRVRRLQKDLAPAEVLVAQAHAVLAEQNAADREAAVSRFGPADGDPRTFLASVAAGRALAADAFAARRRQEEAQTQVTLRLEQYAETSVREDGVARVVDRHDEEYAALLERRDAAERDDIAGAAHQRKQEDR